MSKKPFVPGGDAKFEERYKNVAGYVLAKVLAVALAAGMVFPGCPAEPEAQAQEDIWSNITSLYQMDGTWKGSYSQTQTIEDFMGEDWNENTMAAKFGAMWVTMTIETTMTINAAAKTRSRSAQMTVTFSGGNIATTEVWEELKAGLNSEGATVNDVSHSVSMEQLESKALSEMEISEMVEGSQINQNGTKIKIPVAPGDDSPELLLIKQ